MRAHARPVRRRSELELGKRVQRKRLQRAVGADERGDEVVRRLLEDRARRVVLREAATPPQDGDPVADLDRLVDVVRDEDDGLPHLALQAQELVLQTCTHDRVDRAERLVHQHERRVARQRPREADALALAAGELRRVALRVGRIETDEVEELQRARVDPGTRPAVQPRDGPDVRLDGHVREEADLLDDVADAAPQLHEVLLADALPVDADVAARQLDQPVDEPERRRLATARRPDEHADLTRGDGEREPVDCRAVGSRVLLGRIVEDELRGLARHPVNYGLQDRV